MPVKPGISLIQHQRARHQLVDRAKSASGIVLAAVNLREGTQCGGEICHAWKSRVSGSRTTAA